MLRPVNDIELISIVTIFYIIFRAMTKTIFFFKYKHQIICFVKLYVYECNICVVNKKKYIDEKCLTNFVRPLIFCYLI